MNYIYNDGSLEEHIVQNRFTAYLRTAAKHHRAGYIQNLRQQQREIPWEEIDALPVEMEFALPDSQLHTVLSQLHGQVQTIVLEHILGDKSLVQLARELDMPYPTVKAIYRRALDKLRKELWDEFH